MRDSTERRQGTELTGEGDGTGNNQLASGLQAIGSAEHDEPEVPARRDESRGCEFLSETEQQTRECRQSGLPQDNRVAECSTCGADVSTVTERAASNTADASSRAGGKDDAAAPGRKTWTVVALVVLACIVLGWVVLKWSSIAHNGRYAQSAPEAVRSADGVKRFTVSNFSQDVLNVSQTRPVLIEFYSPI
jgi:hypothetical protein